MDTIEVGTFFPQGKLSFEIVVKRLSLSNASTLSEKTDVCGSSDAKLSPCDTTQRLHLSSLGSRTCLQKNCPSNFTIFLVALR